MVRGGIHPRRGRGRGGGGEFGGSSSSGRFHRSRSPIERRSGGISRGSRSRYRGGGIRRRTPSPFVPRESPPSYRQQRRRKPSPFVPRDSPPSSRRSHSRRRTPSPFQPRDSIDPLIEAIRRKTEQLRRSVERHEQNLISTADDQINYGGGGSGGGGGGSNHGGGLQSGTNEFYSEPNDLTNIDDEFDYNDDDNNFEMENDDYIDNFDNDIHRGGVDNYSDDDDDRGSDQFTTRHRSNSQHRVETLDRSEYLQLPVRIKDPTMPLDEEKCIKIRHKILSDIDEILISSTEEPQFHISNFTIENGVGYFDIQCANTETEKWLIKNVLSWRNLWEGQTMPLQCQEAPQIRTNMKLNKKKLNPNDTSRYVLEFHSGKNKVRDILRKFGRADPSLDVFDWIVIRSVCVSGDNIIRVSVPDVAYFKLRKTNMVPRGLSPIYKLTLISEGTTH